MKTTPQIQSIAQALPKTTPREEQQYIAVPIGKALSAATLKALYPLGLHSLCHCGEGITLRFKKQKEPLSLKTFLQRLLPDENGIIEFAKPQLHPVMGEEFLRDSPRTLLTRFCKENGYTFMPRKLRIQKEYNGKIVDYYQIKIQ